MRYSKFDSLVRAFLIGRLSWASPVYYIYSDEAGTSKREPVTVVAAIIMNADKHWMKAANKLAAVLDEHVPPSLRQGFVFHAKQIRAGYRNLDAEWTGDKRNNLIAAVASIPRELQMAISIGKVRRDFHFPIDKSVMKLHEFHHMIAFGRCISRANKYINDFADPAEVATLVAEDVPDMRRFLKKALSVPAISLPMNEFYVMPTVRDRSAGYIMQTNAGPINKIVDSVNFLEKQDSPFLQIADACAYSFRRYFAGEVYGEDFIKAMLGVNLYWQDWQGPMSEMTFSFNPEHRYP